MGAVLDVRFDIDKLESATRSPAYGPEAWRVFWDAVDPAQLSAAALRDGDTEATLTHQEHVFCIEVAASPDALQATKEALTTSTGYQQVAASPPFTETSGMSTEPLADAGRVVDGELTAESGWAGAALHAARAAAPIPLAQSAPSVPNGVSLRREGAASFSSNPQPALDRREDKPQGASRGTLRRRWPWAVLGTIGLLGAVVVGFMLLGRGDQAPETTPPVTTPADASASAGPVDVSVFALQVGDCLQVREIYTSTDPPDVATLPAVPWRMSRVPWNFGGGPVIIRRL